MSSLIELTRSTPYVEPLTGLTSWQVCRHLADLSHLLFLDSAQRSEHGRYSYVSADPAHLLISRNGWIRNGQVWAAIDPLLVLADRLAAFSMEPILGLPPFQGGAAGLFGYGLCHQFERLPRPEYDDFASPDL